VAVGGSAIGRPGPTLAELRRQAVSTFIVRKDYCSLPSQHPACQLDPTLIRLGDVSTSALRESQGFAILKLSASDGI
jgi:hypothetical protein